jgi:hypothetical protein
MELYKQALGQLQRAVDELDQAHATLKDIEELTDAGIALLEALKLEQCDECWHPISRHDDKCGCDVDRGDQLVGEVLTAMGPCCCEAFKHPYRGGKRVPA